MKKIILMMLLVMMLLTTGCEIGNRYICVRHSDIRMNQTPEGDWVIPKGTVRIQLGISKHEDLCDRLENRTQ